MSVSSRHGGTAEIGARVAQALRDGGHEVDVIAPDDVTQVASYHAVVLGTSVYIGRVGLDIKDLVDRQGAALHARPVWMFWSGPVDGQPDNSPPPEDVVDIARGAGVRQLQVFGGRLDKDGLTVTEKSLLARTSAEPGDRRDLNLAYAWGRQIATDVTNAAMQAR
ncbi:MAG: flavodoxin domain-containing protein [Micrococcales bacterium]|nr:flavodoxin domain-containing protein [Micrococcales bacterium]